MPISAMAAAAQISRKRAKKRSFRVDQATHFSGWKGGGGAIGQNFDYSHPGPGFLCCSRSRHKRRKKENRSHCCYALLTQVEMKRPLGAELIGKSKRMAAVSHLPLRYLNAAPLELRLSFGNLSLWGANYIRFNWFSSISINNFKNQF